jgi:hypothetical protein
VRDADVQMCRFFELVCLLLIKLIERVENLTNPATFLYLTMQNSFLVLSWLLTCYIQVNKAYSSRKQADLKGAVIRRLEIKKDSIDKLLEKRGKSVLVYAKAPGRKTWIAITNDKWPDKIDYTYNVLKNASGKIILIAQIPYSESGDWDIEHFSYFDEGGKIFAFVDKQSIFTDYKGGIVREISTRYFDENFHQLKKADELVDKDFKPVRVDKHNFDFRDDQFIIYKNANECLGGYGFRLAQ